MLLSAYLFHSLFLLKTAFFCFPTLMEKNWTPTALGFDMLLLQPPKERLSQFLSFPNPELPGKGFNGPAHTGHPFLDQLTMAKG